METAVVSTQMTPFSPSPTFNLDVTTPSPLALCRKALNQLNAQFTRQQVRQKERQHKRQTEITSLRTERNKDIKKRTSGRQSMMTLALSIASTTSGFVLSIIIKISI